MCVCVCVCVCRGGGGGGGGGKEGKGKYDLKLNDRSAASRKHIYIILTPPQTPLLYINICGFTGVYISFLISAINIDCGYSLQTPR